MIDSKMKGIILAGGSGTRLHPITTATSKQLLPIYNKPMIYYPLSTLISVGINTIMIITTPQDHKSFKKLLGDGHQFGVTLEYEIQPYPRGIAEAFLIGRQFIGSDPVTLILGDNIFYGQSICDSLIDAVNDPTGATIFGYSVFEPSRYGVIAFGSDGSIGGIIEKPQSYISNYAVVGLYVYDNSVIDIALNITPSHRGELEITDVNNVYLSNKRLKAKLIKEWDMWFDAGTFDSLLEASNLIGAIEKRQGTRVGCPYEEAIKRGLIIRNHPQC